MQTNLVVYLGFAYLLGGCMPDVAQEKAADTPTARSANQNIHRNEAKQKLPVYPHG